jgi:hypothetical protein
MADVVIVLGAGCSCDAGAPLMNSFLDRARDLLDAGLVNHWRQDFDLVFRAVGRLGAVHSKANLDVVNLEAVFNSFEMARQLNKFPGLTDEEVDRLIPAMTTVIVRTIELSMKFPMSGGAPHAPKHYEELANIIHWAYTERRPSLSIAIISFNYDIGVDVALTCARVGYCYALNDADASGLPLLKLHGSLNWIRNGETVRVLPIREMLQPRHSFPGEARAPVNLAISLDHPSIGKQPAPPLPFIVPPTMSKGEYHRQIVPVWRRAAKELGSAQHLFVCGYSLPNTDEFFKVLYALGSEGPQPLRTLCVHDPDTGAHERFRAILGPGAVQRFREVKGGFNTFSALLRGSLENN